MEELIKLQKQLIPDLLQVLDIRYKLLRNVKYRQPIGRRLLSATVHITERIVRSETNFLKDQGLIDISSAGMYITKDGEEVLNGLREFMREINGINLLEIKLKKLLGVHKVVVVSGNVDEDDTLYAELGKAAANYLKQILKDDIIISLTGGRTIKEVVDSFPILQRYRNIKVLPGRGGMGKETELQANTLVETLANKIGASYEQLHIPDNLSQSLFDAMLREGEIQGIFNSICNSNILIHGIGLADDMCEKRSLTEDVKYMIMKNGAVGEAFGHYFDKNGKIVYSMPTIGIHQDDIDKIPRMIAVSVGVHKAKAIAAIEKGRSNSVLITDENTAKEIVEILNCVSNA